MWWLKNPAFIIDTKTLTRVEVGEFDEMVLKLFIYLFMGCVVVEAPKDDAILEKLMDSTLYFHDYYEKYFSEYMEQFAD